MVGTGGGVAVVASMAETSFDFGPSPNKLTALTL